MSIFFVCLWTAMLSLMSSPAAVGTSVAGDTCALLEAPLWKGRTEPGYRITAPQYAISGLLVMVQVERRGAGVEGIEECQLCYTVGTGSDASPQTCLPVNLYMGKGSASLRLNNRGESAGDRGTAWLNLRPHDHQDPGTGLGILLAQAIILVLHRQDRDEDAHCDEVHSGILLTDESLVWQPHAIICVLSNITVPAGKVLQVFRGTTVLISRGADVIVHGVLQVMGTVESPVIWMPMHLEPWGGIQLTGGPDVAEHAENRNLFMHSWFVGGGDSLYYRSEENSQSQPVVLIESSTLTMVGGGMVDSPGRKAFYASNSSIFAHCIQVWRCDTVGEFEGSHLHLEGAIMTEFPDGDFRANSAKRLPKVQSLDSSKDHGQNALIVADRKEFTEILFMVMGEKIHFFLWYEMLREVDANVFFIYASFDEEVPSKGGISDGNYTCMRNDAALRCQTIFIPNTTWTEGRNLLAEEAVREEKRSGKPFTFWAFADDDISCHIANHEMVNKIYNHFNSTWENLECWQHVFDYMGSSIVPERASNIAISDHNYDSSFQAASNLDACFVAFKRDYVPFFIPYPTLRPGFSWWMSQAAIFCVIETCFRQSTALVYIYVRNNMGMTKFRSWAQYRNFGTYVRGFSWRQLNIIIADNYQVLYENVDFELCPDLETDHLHDD